jgi:GTP-binding protein HflX
VLADLDALDVPEQIVFNKADAADPETQLRLRSLVPNALFVSAHTGAGLAALAATIEAGLPRPDRSVRALIPYTRGDLVARIHSDGEVLSEDHTGDGTLISARVRSDLAAALAEFGTG